MSQKTPAAAEGKIKSLARRLAAWVTGSTEGSRLAWRSRQAEMEAKLKAYEGLRSHLLALQAAAAALGAQEPTFACEVATSDPAVLTARPGPGAEEGFHRVQVRSLASRHRVASGLWPAADTALGLSGEFLVNGQPVAVRARDSLMSLREAINLGSDHVDAAVDGSRPFRLVLTARRAGTAGQIALVDANGDGILERLGLVRGASGLKHPRSSAAGSDYFPSPDRGIGPMLGLRQSPRGTVCLSGRRLTVDLAFDSLADIARRITAGGGQTRARVCRTRGGAAARYGLEIASPGAAPRLSDGGNVLHTLGLLAKPLAHELREPAEAEVVVDGARFVRASNTVSRAISGATLTLVNPAGDREVLVCVRRRGWAMLGQARRFVAGFNRVLEVLSRACDPGGDGGRAGALLEAPVAAALSGDLTSMVEPGGPMRALREVGVAVGPNGRLHLDEAAHRRALAAWQGCWPPRAARAARDVAELVGDILDPVTGPLKLASQGLRQPAQGAATVTSGERQPDGERASLLQDEAPAGRQTKRGVAGGS